MRHGQVKIGIMAGKYAGIPEWSNGSVCRTDVERLRGFESLSQHK